MHFNGLSTLTWDFGLTVLTDGCLDAAPEVHRVLTEKVFPAGRGSRGSRRAPGER